MDVCMIGIVFSYHRCLMIGVHRCRKWGDCVVRVLMEKTMGGNMPMYGRIIFKTEAIMNLVLNGERLVKITIDHRQIWLRKYVPRETNTVT